MAFVSGVMFSDMRRTPAAEGEVIRMESRASSERSIVAGAPDLSKRPNPQAIVTPPSTTIPWPVMNEPAFDASITATPAISSGWPMRRSGVVLL
jgi:hypothetical protein